MMRCEPAKSKPGEPHRFINRACRPRRLLTGAMDQDLPEVLPLVNAVSALIAISLLLLLGLGVAALLLAGTRSGDANDADPPPRR